MDEKDWEIIVELQKDARMPLSDIAKNTGLSTNTVKKRLKRLKDERLLIFNIAMVDYHGLGYQSNIAYIRLHHYTKEEEKEIIKYLCISPYPWFVASTEGHFNIMAIFIAKKHEKFLEIWKELKGKFRKQIGDIDIVPLHSWRQFSQLNEVSKPEDRKEYKMGTGKRYNASKHDVDIINLITPDCRMSVSEISRKTGLSKSAVRYRMDKMEREGLIQGYYPVLNLEKLGYLYFKVDFFLSSLDRQEELEKRLEKERSVLTIMKTSGNADVAITMYSKSIYELNAFIKSLMEEFPGVISSYQVNSILNIFKGLPHYL